MRTQRSQSSRGEWLEFSSYRADLDSRGVPALAQLDDGQLAVVVV